MFLSDTLTSLARQDWQDALRDNLSVSDRNHTEGSSWINAIIDSAMTGHVREFGFQKNRPFCPFYLPRSLSWEPTRRLDLNGVISLTTPSKARTSASTHAEGCAGTGVMRPRSNRSAAAARR